MIFTRWLCRHGSFVVDAEDWLDSLAWTLGAVALAIVLVVAWVVWREEREARRAPEPGGDA